MTDAPEPRALERSGSNRATALIALLAGLLSALGAVIVPFLPVKEHTAALVWPSRLVGDVNAPLLSYFPEQFDLRVPCSAANTLPTQSAGAATPAGGAVLFSTIPKSSSLADTRGLVVRLTGPAQARSLQVVLRGETLLVAPAARLAEPGCKAIVVASDRAGTTVEVQGLAGASASRSGSNTRPQIVGFYSDLSGRRDDPALSGITARASIDTRFITSPTATKLVFLIASALLLVVSLYALGLLDRVGRRARPKTPWARHLFTPRPVDVLVAAALGVWHVIGANTADDNYMATMARASRNGGYIANYYRYFGAPDDPWGWFYQVTKLMADTGVSSPWVRLPVLFVNLGTWFVLSRFVLPRVLRPASKPAALIGGWTAALVFLCFVFAYDNGLRPEPWIALGVISAWALVEHAISTRRLLPLGLAGLVASATVTCGPTGTMVYFTVILAAKPLLRLLRARAEAFGGGLLAWGAVLAPLAAAFGSASLIGFWRISYGAFRAATTDKIVVGPYLHWYEEIARYQGLMGFSPDGSFSRRFPMLVMLLLLVVVAGVLWRGDIADRLGRHIPVELSVGPTRRLVGLVFIGLLCLMLTPTKPTHHFGAFAGIGAAVVGVGTVAVLTITTARSRALYAAALLFLIGLTYTGPNDWWYPAGYGAPFRNTAIRFGVSLGTVFYYLGGLALVVALFLHLFGRAPTAGFGGRISRTLLDKRLIASGILLGAALTIVVELGATAVQAATVDYSSPARNISAVIGGSECGLADAVLVDTDPNRSILRPVSQTGSSADALLGDGARGFAITAPEEQTAASLLTQANLPDVGPTVDPLHPVPPADPADLVGFGLDPKATPLVISTTSAALPAAELTSHWYQLPEHTSLVTVAAVGYFPAEAVRLEFTTDPASANPEKGQPQSRALVAADRAPGWRDLRLGDVPQNAKAVRLRVRLDLPGPSQWIALTPPRAPKLATLQEVIGRSVPVAKDWEDGLGFPCLRPFGYRSGIVELPQYRVSPDRVTDAAFRPWMDAYGGGPIGIVESVAHAVTMPTYLRGALTVDWGKAQRLIPLASGTKPDVITETVTRSGFANPGPLGSGVAGSSWEIDPSKLH